MTNWRETQFTYTYGNRPDTVRTAIRTFTESDTAIFSQVATLSHFFEDNVQAILNKDANAKVVDFHNIKMRVSVCVSVVTMSYRLVAKKEATDVTSPD